MNKQKSIQASNILEADRLDDDTINSHLIHTPVGFCRRNLKKEETFL